MRKTIYFYLFSSILSASIAFSQTPDFSLVGFASQNGGTTGGEGGTTVSVSNYTDLKKYAETANTKYIIKVSGTITGSGSVADGTYSGSIRIASNKTIIGEGSNTLLNGVGFSISGTKNIIIKNIIFTMTGIKIPAGSNDIDDIYSKLGDEGRAQILVNSGDCISIFGTNTRNIWIDHCEFYNEDPTKQTNQDLYDGLLDAKNDASYITVSWCYFHDHHKCGLVGSSDSDNFDRRMTFHHNYYKNIGARMPLYRFGTGHFFNNYVLGGASGGSGSAINSRMGACMYVENNHFEGKRDPVISKDSKEVGFWNVKNNKFTSCTGNQPTSSNCSFTPSYSYSSALTTNVDNVKALVIAHAGVGKLITSLDEPNQKESYTEFSAYPNPSTDHTTITFSLANNSSVELFVFDQLGNKVKELVNNNLSSGKHEFGLATTELYSGLYIVNLIVNGKSTCHKLVVGNK